MMIKIIKVLVLILILKSYVFESVIIETTHDQTDQQCDFYNQTLVNKVWFVRSPYNCRVYHLCTNYKQYTLTCAEGLYFDESLDSCNFESIVDCPESAQPQNSNNFEFLQASTTNSQSDLFESANQYYYNVDESEAYENADSNMISYEKHEKSGTQNSTSTSTTTSTTTTTSTNTATSSTTSSTLKSTTPVLTFWYQPYTPVTFLLFTYKNNNYQSSKKVENYSDSIPDDGNVIYNVKSLNLNENNDEILLTKSDTAFNMSSNLEESNEYKMNENLYGISSAYNENLNKEINKFFDSLMQEQQENSTTSTTSKNYFTETEATSSFSPTKTSIISTTPIITTTTTSKFIKEFKIETIDKTKINAWWLAPKKCMPGFSHRLSNSQNCALYYECHSNGEKIEKACPYPLLYDEYINECRSYEQVECGSRLEAKHVCDYELSLVNKNKSKCSQYPDCKNLKDGLYPNDDCKNFFQCKDERTLRQLSCPFDAERNRSLVFNIITRRCDHIENTPISCGGYAIQIDIYTGKMVCPNSQAASDLSYELKDIYYKHPTQCNLFIECDKGNMTVLECPDGTHFSPIYQSCVHPSISNCNSNNFYSTSILKSTPTSPNSTTITSVTSTTTTTTTTNSSILFESSINFDNDETRDKTIHSNKLNDSISFSKENEEDSLSEDENKLETDDQTHEVEYDEDDNNDDEEENYNADYDEYENNTNLTTFLDTNSTSIKIITHVTTTENDMFSMTSTPINQLNHHEDNLILNETTATTTTTKTTNFYNNKILDNLTNYTLTIN